MTNTVITPCKLPKCVDSYTLGDSFVVSAPSMADNGIRNRMVTLERYDEPDVVYSQEHTTGHDSVPMERDIDEMLSMIPDAIKQRTKIFTVLPKLDKLIKMTDTAGLCDKISLTHLFDTNPIEINSFIGVHEPVLPQQE